MAEKTLYRLVVCFFTEILQNYNILTYFRIKSIRIFLKKRHLFYIYFKNVKMYIKQLNFYFYLRKMSIIGWFVLAMANFFIFLNYHLILKIAEMCFLILWQIIYWPRTLVYFLKVVITFFFLVFF